MRTYLETHLQFVNTFTIMCPVSFDGFGVLMLLQTWSLRSRLCARGSMTLIEPHPTLVQLKIHIHANSCTYNTHITQTHKACVDMYMHMKTHSTPSYKRAHSPHFFYCSLAITLTLICTHIRAYTFGHTCTSICRHGSTCTSVHASTMPAKDFCEERLLRAP